MQKQHSTCCKSLFYKLEPIVQHCTRAALTGLIDLLHYDVIRAKPDGSCSRPAETGPSVS